MKEQLETGHIEETTSPRNSPVFVIKKKSGKRRMLTDLRKVNKVIQPMGPLQQGLPQPSMIPQNWHIIMVDLKDCFFTIPLQEQDGEKFAFTIPVLNNQQPVKRYHWKVLPQGMLNSPTLRQYYVHQPSQEIRKQFPKALIIHYMDDILFSHEDKDILSKTFQIAMKELAKYGLIIAPEKIQQTSPFNSLGTKIEERKFFPQKVQLRMDHLKTLNDFQKLLGDINWLRPSLGIPTYMLQNLFLTLQGDPDLNSPRTLSTVAKEELAIIEQQMQNAY